MKAHTNNSLRVLIYGQPKTGTTVLTYRIAESLGESTQIIFEPRERDVAAEKSDKIVTKCLFAPHLATPEKISAYNDYEKKIWLARDPRDVIISSCLYRWYRDHKPDINNFKDTLEKVKLKERSPGLIPVHSLDILRVRGDSITVEELKSYHKRTNDVICEFIKNLSNDWLIYKYEDLVNGDFDILNKYLDTKIDNSIEVPKKFTRVTRSKTYGNWRNWFTQEDVEFYKPLYEEYMLLMNYDTNDWRLNENPVLLPELGSEYMEKLFHGDN